MTASQTEVFLLQYLTTAGATESHESILSTLRDGGTLEGSLQLILFPSQQRMILQHPESNYPMFLRLLLDTLSARAELGGDVWALLPLLLKAKNYFELLAVVIKHWGDGHRATEETASHAAALALENGM